jgi:superfamily II DNA or RNA helicase
MKSGYLSNVDYRMHVDNIDWNMFKEIKDLSPKALNKTLFIKEWNDAVIDVLQDTWKTVPNPRAIVFCSTIEHAILMKNKLNARQFTKTGVIYSGSYQGKSMNPIERSIVLCDFADGKLGIMCAVDIFNEGIDVPDVNILVFQRVTHSRRIFVQQLGRGLRISEGKEKVIVLDFVSDIRRFAAGLDLKNKLSSTSRYIQINNPVKFVNKSGEDKNTETFLKKWLDDVEKIQDMGENDHILKFPPNINQDDN